VFNPKPRDWIAAGYTEKPWYDYQQLLAHFGIEVEYPHESFHGPAYTAEEEHLNKVALNKFYHNMNDEKIAGLRKLLNDLAWWNNTSLSHIWGYFAKLDDATMLKVCYPLFFMLWD
jgi:hypothetical protein